jgi:hypothetical protein
MARELTDDQMTRLVGLRKRTDAPPALKRPDETHREATIYRWHTKRGDVLAIHYRGGEVDILHVRTGTADARRLAARSPEDD